MPANAPSALLSRHHRLSRLSCLSRLLRCLLPGVLLRCFLLAAFCFAVCLSPPTRCCLFRRHLYCCLLLAACPASSFAAFCFAVCLSLRLHAAACSAATCIAVSCSPLPGVLLRCFSFAVCLSPPPTRCCCSAGHLYEILLLASCPRPLRCFRLAAVCPAVCPSAVLARRPAGSSFSPFAPALLLSPSCSSSCSAAPSGRSELVPASVPGTSGFAPSSRPFLRPLPCLYSFSSVFTAFSFHGLLPPSFVCRLLLLFLFRGLPLLPFSALSSFAFPAFPPAQRLFRQPHYENTPDDTAGCGTSREEPITTRAFSRKDVEVGEQRLRVEQQQLDERSKRAPRRGYAVCSIRTPRKRSVESSDRSMSLMLFTISSRPIDLLRGADIGSARQIGDAGQRRLVEFRDHHVRPSRR